MVRKTVVLIGIWRKGSERKNQDVNIRDQFGYL